MQAPSRNKIRWLEGALCVALLCTLLFFSSSPIDTVKRSLSLCYTTVIPAVFPFMIVSALLLHTGAHRLIGALLRRPMKILFGCSGSGSNAVALGYLCGFPIGAVSAATLYHNGEISKNELNRLLLFVNNPSAAFVIGGVGMGLFNSAQLGRLLYISVLIPSALVGIVSRFFFPKDRSEKQITTICEAKESDGLALAFTRAIGESAANMLTVCACVVFFSIPVGIIAEVFGKTGIDPSLSALLSSFFEISGGCCASLTLSSPTQALMLCAFACSWSGLSVHLQIFSVLGKCDVSFKPYIISKLIQSLISPLLILLFSRGATEVAFSDTAHISASPTSQLVFLLLFIFSVVFAGVLYSCKRVASRRV